MITISLCMIVKNEEERLGICLESIKDLVDEIIIVDTGSTDKTVEIARGFNAKIYHFTWVDDFSAARNFSFSKASKDYTMWLDADDVILEKDREPFIKMKKELDPAIHTVTMHYSVKNGLRIRRNRLVKTDKGFLWNGHVHEYLVVTGPIYHSNINITHLGKKGRTHRNLKIYERLIEKEVRLSPRDLFYYANELRRHKDYEKAIAYYQLFLQSDKGWIEDKITACGKLADCYYRIGDYEKERDAVYQSFSYDVPRADFCCRLGFRYLTENLLPQAVFWYELASKLEWDDNCMGFYNEPCWTWLPHLQLCVCYFKMGNYEKSYEHIKKALEYSPGNATFLRNKSLVEIKLKTHQE